MLITELLSKRDDRTLAIRATDSAEHVLPYFEEKYPKETHDADTAKDRDWQFQHLLDL
jgi:hypothetical protein